MERQVADAEGNTAAAACSRACKTATERKETMTHFIGVVEKDPGSAYGIWFPDIPGCFSAADDEEDLFPNACQAIILHLEGEEIPEPRKIAEIRRLENVRRAHARGAYLMSVPFLRTGGRKGRLNVTGDEEMISAIADAARQRGITRSAFLMQAARKEIMSGGTEGP